MLIISELNFPTDAEMRQVALRWWEKLLPVSFYSYNDELMDHTIPYIILPITSRLIEKTLALIDGPTEYDMRLVNDSYTRLIADSLVVLDCQDRFFCKLISRSPKDFLGDECNHDMPTALTNPQELIRAITSSMRCFDDLVLLKHLPEYAAIVIRPFIEIRAQDEWRVFVRDYKIVGISQYHYQSQFNDMRVGDIEQSIRIFVRDILNPNMGISTYVADVITNGSSIILLETNPYGLSDPCLFVNYESLDGTMRWLK